MSEQIPRMNADISNLKNDGIQCRDFNLLSQHAPTGRMFTLGFSRTLKQ